MVSLSTNKLSRRGFTVIEALIAMVISAIGISMLFGSLQNVNRNRSDGRTKQIEASSVESAIEMIRRENSSKKRRLMDTTYIDRSQGQGVTVKIKGTMPDRAVVVNCILPDLALQSLAQMEITAYRSTAGISKDTLKLTTLMWGDL
jgi:prepilin-type N-terminal cleavage/methylation domain-containing protein